MDSEWTGRYYGVQHRGELNTEGHWFTVVSGDGFAISKHWFPNCGFNPTRKIHKTPELARAHCDKLFHKHYKPKWAHSSF